MQARVNAGVGSNNRYLSTMYLPAMYLFIHIAHSTSHGTNAAVSPGMQVSSVLMINDVLCRSRRNPRLGAQQDGPTPT